MSKYRPPPLGLAGKLALAALIVGIAYAAVHATPLQLLAAAAAVAALMLWARLGGWASVRRLRAMAAARPDDSICTFARGFDCRAVDTWVIRAVYEELQAGLAPAVSRFPLRASDTLRGDLDIEADDLDLDLVPAIAARAGRSLDGAERNPHREEVTTVGGLVRFMAAQPRATASQD